MYHGDFRLGQTLDLKFTTRKFSTGAPFALAGSPVISAYVGNSTTQITAGITLSVDFDSVTGLNNVRVVASSGNGFATATDIELVITTGTVDSVSVVGEVIGSFSIENRSALMPTTAGRTLVVDAAGLADANAVKVGPTGSGTAQTAGDIPARLPAALGANGNIKADVRDLIGTAWLAPGTAGTPDVNVKLWNALTTVELPLVPTTAGRKLDVSAGGEAGLDWANVGAPTTTVGLTGTTISASQVVASVTAGVTLAASAVQAIWDALTSALTTAGSIGKLIVDNLNATITSRMATYTQPTGFLAATFPGTVASTTNITAGTMTTTTNLTNLPSIPANWITATGITDGALTAAKFASGAFDAVWTVTVRTLSSYGTLVADIATAVWGAATRILTAGTNIVLAKGTGVTGFNDPTVGAIADQVWEEILADHSGTSGSTAAALNAAGAAGDPWSTALPGAYGAGTAGKIIGDNINATVGSRATQTSVDDLPTNAELATALAAADDAVLAAIAALNNLSAANIRTAVGLASANLDTQLDALPTAAELATALAAADDAVIAAIAALNNLSAANVRTAVGLASANLDTQLDALPTNAELATALGTADDAVLAAIAVLQAFVDTEVAAIKTVTDQLVAAQSEPTGVPAANATPLQKLAWMALIARNRIQQTATAQTIKADDGSTTVAAATVSDDGTTFTRGEFA